MKEMYKGMVNSPQTKLSKAINSADTDIYVKDGSVFPVGPNLAVIGLDQSAETVLYSSVNNNVLIGCTRGFQGEAKSWEGDTPIARNFTEADLSAVQENIRMLNEKTLADLSDDSDHRTVSDKEKDAWNSKVDKVDGKALSTNDFTDEYKSRLDRSINKITFEAPMQSENGYIVISKNDGVTEKVVVNSTDGRFSGLMHWEDKKKLDSIESEANKITKLSEMEEDTNHRFVTDEEKTSWNGKVNSDQLFVKESYEEQEKKYGYDKIIPTMKSLQASFETFEESIIKHVISLITLRLKNYKQQVILTQSEYDALSTDQQNDESKIYFIREE